MELDGPRINERPASDGRPNKTSQLWFLRAKQALVSIDRGTGRCHWVYKRTREQPRLIISTEELLQANQIQQTQSINRLTRKGAAKLLILLGNRRSQGLFQQHTHKKKEQIGHSGEQQTKTANTAKHRSPASNLTRTIDSSQKSKQRILQSKQR